jgi:hypothetical protein
MTRAPHCHTPPQFKAVAALTLHCEPLRSPFCFDEVQTRILKSRYQSQSIPAPSSLAIRISLLFIHTALFISRKPSIDVQLSRHLAN